MGAAPRSLGREPGSRHRRGGDPSHGDTWSIPSLWRATGRVGLRGTSAWVPKGVRSARSRAGLRGKAAGGGRRRLAFHGERGGSSRGRTHLARALGAPSGTEPSGGWFASEGWSAGANSRHLFAERERAACREGDLTVAATAADPRGGRICASLSVHLGRRLRGCVAWDGEGSTSGCRLIRTQIAPFTICFEFVSASDRPRVRTPKTGGGSS